MNTHADYQTFIAAKSAQAPKVGFEPVAPFPVETKAFQADLTRLSLRRGRSALFAGTGLGKTLMQLIFGDQVERHAGGQILGLCPLAVAEQTIREAEKFGIKGVGYAESQRDATHRINLTNYERFKHFDAANFVGVIPDESSIIKAHDSQTRLVMTQAFADTPFKLPCSATPAPNDWVELGSHAEFLGVCTQGEMLATFFVHDGANRAADPSSGHDGWRLKRHAQDDFWRWVATWAAMIRAPKDLGYDEPGYDLPPLNWNQVTLPSEAAPGEMFAREAQTLSDRLGARRNSIEARAAAAAAIVNAQPNLPWLIWCGLNAEAEALLRLIPGALEVRGPDDPNLKKERLLGFCHGRPLKLVTKPSIGGFGMNWQHCQNMVFVGLNDSFEQIYQAVRRCWRFGQLLPVNVYLIATEREGAVVRNVRAKEAAFELMAEAMAANLIGHIRAEIAATSRRAILLPTQKLELPTWLN